MRFLRLVQRLPKPKTGTVSGSPAREALASRYPLRLHPRDFVRAMGSGRRLWQVVGSLAVSTHARRERVGADWDLMRRIRTLRRWHLSLAPSILLSCTAFAWCRLRAL